MDLPCPIPSRIVVVGDGGSPLAVGLRALGHEVEELLPSDFQTNAQELADVVAVLPGCPEPCRIGAVAAAAARTVWFQERPAPPELAEILAAAGVPVVEDRDLLRECGG